VTIAVLGTGAVGRTIASKLVELGHDVIMGSRTRDSDKAAEWVRTTDGRGAQGTFADAAGPADVVFNCTSGVGSLAAVELAGRDRLRRKILIDVSNPLDFSRGMPPSLTVCNTDSLGEQIQRALPETKVVKTLNTVNHLVMVDPLRIPGDHVIYVAGNDAGARAQVAGWLGDWFGWKPGSIIDLGDITAARGTEMVLPLWIRLMSTLGTPVFNFTIAR
jgi:8-hydroxy-5-deazaflavin:NADPH oxidoreductase